MHTPEAMLDLHRRAGRSMMGLLAHCRGLSVEEFSRHFADFGYATVQLQLHHLIGAEEYWIGVLQGRLEADENASDYPTVEALTAYSKRVCSVTESYLRAASLEELNTARPMLTWGGREQVLTPVHVVMRILTHRYHHQGQVAVMCRLLGKPPGSLDYSIE